MLRRFSAHRPSLLVPIWGLLLTALGSGLLPSEAAAQRFRRNLGATPAAAAWPMEQVTLQDGRIFAGLIETMNDTSLEFVEIHRPQGRPMFLVVRPIERTQVKTLSRLSEQDRKVLEERIHSFKNRARIEARQMEAVKLTPVTLDGTRFFRYEGDWLELESSTSEQLTRRIIVRVEQVLLAFRQVLPPRQTPQSGTPIQLKIFGTTDQYYQYLRDQKLDLRNPAYYDAGRNLVVAGSGINDFADRLVAIRQQHARELADYNAQAAGMPAQLKQLQDQLEKNGHDLKERRKILAAQQQRWQKQRDDLERRIAQADRKNEALLEEVVDQMLRRLYHETFHAYLEENVYPSAHHDVPRWLNEGLAQVFEAGRLEAGSLRVDAPAPHPLAQLQADLKSDKPLLLADVLSAEPDAFLVPHGSGGRVSARHYLYSWGLAYYLTFELGLFEGDAIDRYVAADAAKMPAVARFEQLVGMPLDKFEPLWRNYLLSLQAPQ